ncbi:unnamed protein product, partial [Mesorhabditis spiculigera]
MGRGGGGEQADPETNFVYAKPPVKNMILKASLLIVVLANITLFFAVYEMSLTVPFGSGSYMGFGIVMLTVSLCAMFAVLSDKWRFLCPLFFMLFPCAFVPVLYFIYYVSVPLFCRLQHMWAGDTSTDIFKHEAKLQTCIAGFPGTDFPQATFFLYFGIEKLLELYLVAKLLRVMQRDEQEVERSIEEGKGRRCDYDSDEDMIVYERLPQKSKKLPPKVIDRCAK